MLRGEYGYMNISRRNAVAALVAAGLLWGTTVPLSKLALQWLAPGWLTVARFGLAAAILLPVARHRRPKGARGDGSPRWRGILDARLLVSGAIGYGGSVVVQNAGLSRTSVTHAALLIGAVPVLVAVIAALWLHTVARPVAWAGFALSLAGVGLVTAAEVAGAFLNLEPLVGAIAGVVFFANPVGPRQLAGGLGIVAGIGLSSLRSGQVRAEQGQVGGRQPVAGGLGLVPEGVDERGGAGGVEPGALVGEEDQRRCCEVVG